MQHYMNILSYSIYTVRLKNKIINEEMISDKEREILEVKLNETQRKIYNNMGCIWISLGEYHEANKIFTKICEKDSDIEIAYFDQMYSTPQKKKMAVKEKAGRMLNYATMLIKQNSKDYEIPSDNSVDTKNLYNSIEIKLEQCYNKNLIPGIVNEVEILSLILSIKIKLGLKKLEACEKDLILLKRIIGAKSEISSNELLWDIVNQYYYYCKAKLDIAKLKKLRQAENDYDQVPSPFSSPI